MLREHTFDPVMERRLFSASSASPSELPQPLALPAKHFACLLAWDARGASAEAVSSIAESLLRAGASYFVCWGPDCERVHDLVDEVSSHPGGDFGIPEDSCIITTWHHDDPLREALGYFLVNSWPDPYYQDSTRAALAIAIGSSDWAAEIRDALDQPREFVRHWAEEDAAE